MTDQKKISYKILDFPNINHHNNEEVEIFLNNNFGDMGYELLTVLNLGENNTNKDGKSSRFRYIFKKNE